MAKNFNELRKPIDFAWKSTNIRTDWLGLEESIRSILESYKADVITMPTAVELIDEAVGAFTKRGRILED